MPCRICLRVQNAGSFCAQMTIWRVTAAEDPSSERSDRLRNKLSAAHRLLEQDSTRSDTYLGLRTTGPMDHVREFANGIQVVSEPEERTPRHARSVIHTRRSMTSSHSRFADGRLRGGGDEIITDPSPAVFPAHRGVRKCDRTLSSAQPIPETLRGACRGKVATSSDDTFPGESIVSPSQPREHLGPSVPSLHSPCRQVYSAKPRADPPGTRLPRNERRGSGKDGLDRRVARNHQLLEPAKPITHP
jgi:hypothetical protein